MRVFVIILYIVMVLVSLYLAANFILRRARRINETALIYKAIASVSFVLLGFVGYWGSNGATSMIILPALIMGLVGDIFLDMKFIYPESDTLYTNVGFGSFILGEIFYLIFLLDQYGLFGTPFVISIIIGILAGAAAFLTPALFNLHYGQFRIVFAIYIVLLLLNVVYSVILCFIHFSGARLMFCLGHILLFISVFVLASIFFGHDRNTPKNSIISHSAYYLAQIIIAASIFFI